MMTIDRDEAYRSVPSTIDEFGIVTLDRGGYITSWSPGIERIERYTGHEIVGRHFSIFHPEEERAAGRAEHELEVALRDGCFEEEGWRIRKDGSRFWANVTITPIRDETGELRGFAKLICDVSERRHMAAALRESEDRFRLLVESVSEYAIFMLDEGGRIASWNRGAERIKGYRAEEIIGKHFSVFYSPEDVAAGKPQRTLEVAAREGVMRDESWRVRKDGTRFWADLTVTALTDGDGKLGGFAKVTRDMTERRGAEEAIRELNASLERRVEERTAELAAAVRVREDFLSIASHELRTPLSALTLQVRTLGLILRGPADDGEARKLAEQRIALLARQADRLNHLVNQLLDVTRLSAGRLALARERVDLVGVVQDVVSRMRDVVERSGSSLTVETREPVVGSWDPLRLETIVANLLSNAAKYGSGQPIRVQVDQADGLARVRVIDAGIGIPADRLDAIFERFDRAGRDEHYGGFGIGLWVAREFTEAHGGKIHVASEERKGSTFTVELPVEPTGDGEVSA